MLLTITTTHRPATDLGFLLHKRPGRPQEFPLPVGTAQVFYPEAADDRCTVALLLEVDPVGLVRRGMRFPRIDQYVNDRPYAASSFMSVALGRVFRTAMSGRCDARPDLARRALPLTARLPVLPCAGGEGFLRSMFEPLGYAVTPEPHLLDPAFPEWGLSPYLSVTLEGEVRLAELLSHLYVLIPVLDGSKHYWVEESEVAQLLRRGEPWLSAHPERELIASRSLARDRALTGRAMEQLLRDEPQADDEAAGRAEADEEAGEAPVRPSEARLGAVLAVLRGSGARRVLALGCGPGKLLAGLIAERQFTEIVGADVSHQALQTAARRLRLDRMPSAQRGRVHLMQTALTYRDRRLAGFDAAAVVEVIEHLDPVRLAGFTRVLFGATRPRTVVVTTPNREYNVLFDGMAPGAMRHRDHRFEWTRDEFRAWSGGAAAVHGYEVRHVPVGPEDAQLGAPTQMAVFTLR
ncbi:MAG TPA: 3' terminal RNA ribose 2'-O-methyltransferase Hen1 [Miltoncostaeaceae bacterium]|nr:3' terminal RNA ribose 2'-O-methyltransferase Hen1 [Miltoncostaeaceae bacterium]